MKLTELHILQSFPPSCLNRDDLGAPKSAIFGGVERSRISSQCMKRASRIAAREFSPNFQGVRTRFLKDSFTEALIKAGVKEKEAEGMSQAICDVFGGTSKKDEYQVTTAVYLSPAEIDQIAAAVAKGEHPKKAAKNAERLDAADISLFGRMVANDATLGIEGAAMFSHAISTHKANNSLDFFSAVDDRKMDADDSGASMIGNSEFNSATYYRYASVNLNLLFDPKHLGGLELADRKETLAAFIRAVVLAVPSARKNSMNAATLPIEVLGIAKEKGQPVQLVNAFESPVKGNGHGLAGPSLDAMKSHLEKLKKTWGLVHADEVWLTEVGLDGFISKLVSHVK